MFRHYTNPHLWLILSIDIILVTLSYLFAYELRFDVIGPVQLSMLKMSLPAVITSKIIVFFIFHLYSGPWGYTGLRDLFKIAGAGLVSTLLIITYFTLQYRFAAFSRSVFLIDCLLTIFLIGGFRLAIRTYYFPEQIKHIFRFRDIYAKDKKRLLIIGASRGGEKLLRTIIENVTLYDQYILAGFLDDDPAKKGKKLHGVPVIGAIDTLPDIAARDGIGEIMIAISNAGAGAIRRIVNLCDQTGVPFKIIPSMEEIVLGGSKPAPIREVNYDDLLGREPVTVDNEIVREHITGKIVLVTGAGGSIGSELCLQICRYRPRVLLLLELSEYNLHHIERAIKSSFPNITALPFIGSVADRSVVEPIMSEHSPSIVFHAAAYKHVPMMEMNPLQAIKNNVFGTSTIVNMAMKYEVRRFVFISTDKAVRPTSLMGATKRLGELIVQAQAGQSSTLFITVRFGNVVGSGGSVVPLFMQQIKQGGPVTITHPEVTRSFMSLKKAVLLVLQAASMGEGGEVFLLDMGEPIKILSMAEDLIRLAGKRPYEEMDIVFTGLRPGEKLYEELTMAGETKTATLHPKISRITSASVDWSKLHQRILDLHVCVEKRDIGGMAETLRTMMPDYNPSDFLTGKGKKVKSPVLRAIK